jgi:dimeric dUTPase (all-alpha-NTP-PPase superfamily)
MNDEFLMECILYFGIDKQQVVAIEEMAELTQQLSKFVINHSNKNRNNLVEEYVDVLIMLNQLKLIYRISDEEIETRKKFKFNKLKNYIEKRKLEGVD